MWNPEGITQQPLDIHTHEGAVNLLDCTQLGKDFSAFQIQPGPASGSSSRQCQLDLSRGCSSSQIQPDLGRGSSSSQLPAGTLPVLQLCRISSADADHWSRDLCEMAQGWDPLPNLSTDLLSSVSCISSMVPPPPAANAGEMNISAGIDDRCVLMPMESDGILYTQPSRLWHVHNGSSMQWQQEQHHHHHQQHRRVQGLQLQSCDWQLPWGSSNSMPGTQALGAVHLYQLPLSQLWTEDMSCAAMPERHLVTELPLSLQGSSQPSDMLPLEEERGRRSQRLSEKRSQRFYSQQELKLQLPDPRPLQAGQPVHHVLPTPPAALGQVTRADGLAYAASADACCGYNGQGFALGTSSREGTLAGRVLKHIYRKVAGSSQELSRHSRSSSSSTSLAQCGSEPAWAMAGREAPATECLRSLMLARTRGPKLTRRRSSKLVARQTEEEGAAEGDGRGYMVACASSASPDSGMTDFPAPGSAALNSLWRTVARSGGEEALEVERCQGLEPVGRAAPISVGRPLVLQQQHASLRDCCGASEECALLVDFRKYPCGEDAASDAAWLLQGVLPDDELMGLPGFDHTQARTVSAGSADKMEISHPDAAPDPPRPLGYLAGHRKWTAAQRGPRKTHGVSGGFGGIVRSVFAEATLAKTAPKQVFP